MDKPTGSEKNAAGHRWVCWRTGINRYEHRSAAGTISRNHRLTGYYGSPPGQNAGLKNGTGKTKVFRTFEGAAAALAKLAK